MKTVTLGQSDLRVPHICLGTMTFGEQVQQAEAHAILSRSLDLGVNFWDTAEMYAVPARAETYGATETILGNWFAANPGKRQQVVLASKVAGPSRGMPWIRDGLGLTPQDIANSCEGSLRRLQTDVIDLYQIHWPARQVPAFGNIYYDPAKEAASTPIHDQLEALGKLVKAGKVRQIGLSNETPYGVHEFVRLAEEHGLPRVVSTQNAYCLLNRQYENALDETNHRLGVGLLAYSPLAFGLLTGKYDQTGTGEGLDPTIGRIARFASMRKQRWGRAASLETARLYNQLAREHGLTPTELALGFCAAKWQVASTIIGVTTAAQLDEDVKAFDAVISPELMAAIDGIRQLHRDPAA